MEVTGDRAYYKTPNMNIVIFVLFMICHIKYGSFSFHIFQKPE